MESKKKGWQQYLNAQMLKRLAVASMFIDHTGYLLIGSGMLGIYENDTLEYWVWYQIYCAMRSIGRIAFPLYAFLLTEGIIHTKDWRRYGLRLGIFAILSEIPYNLMRANSLTAGKAQNVFFTLLIGLLIVKAAEAACDWIGDKRSEYWVFVWLAAVVAGCAATEWLRTDYSSIGIILIVFLYMSRFERKKQCIGGFLWLFLALGKFYYIWGLAVAFILIYFYNGKKGSGKGRYLYYAIYPVHILFLYLLYWLIFVKYLPIWR